MAPVTIQERPRTVNETETKVASTKIMLQKDPNMRKSSNLVRQLEPVEVKRKRLCPNNDMPKHSEDSPSIKIKLAGSSIQVLKIGSRLSIKVVRA